MSLLKDKKVLIMGLRNKWSIAWGIASVAHSQGAQLIFTYQGEREKEGVEELIKSLDGSVAYECDVSSSEKLDEFFNLVEKQHSTIDSVIHAIAYANKEDLTNPFIQTSKDGFLKAMDISVYSFVAICQRASRIMNDGGNFLTLTYAGSEKVYPGYNVMGVAKAALEASVRYLSYDLGLRKIRVNAISAGAIKTLSAKGVKDFNNILNTVEIKSPLKKNVDLEELGNSALFLISDLSKGITGEIMYVDCGYNIMGM
jgi:enoyl-[acyl-carrier protein] reductase I